MNRTNAVAVIIHEVFAAPIAESTVEEDSSANATGALSKNNNKAPKDAFNFFILVSYRVIELKSKRDYCSFYSLSKAVFVPN